MIIVVAGKGGVGKTVISALLIKKLSQQEKGNVLAIDADPNSNLNLLLGLNFELSLADVREEFKKPLEQPGISKVEYLNLRFQEIIIESENFDLLVMGRPEGPGCYCAVNNLLREIIRRFAGNYLYTVVDSEAGMEHLSRRTTGNIDVLILVSEPTLASFQAVLRSREIARKLNFRIKKVVYLINKIKSELPLKLKTFLEENSFSPCYYLPFSENLYNICEEGESVYNFKDGKYLRNIDIIVEKEILNMKGG